MSALVLKVLLPTKRLLAESVVKIIAEADNGEFCILPRHIDFVSSTVPSVLTYWVESEQSNTSRKHYAAIDQGVLVKCGNEVTITALDGVCSDDLQKLQDQVTQHFLEIDEHERKARGALARLEAATLRSFRDLQERLNG